ncbi:uncharacterized protein LOC110450526 [Mizuhopecten yessoensis]|uniref:uncharacterized protein LOC110450526 n=1 Tax=Mizuhopecten yessoensis TaxID=6573 RepID=UPI000B459A43|nr:uncharacterized protein LOC110450526 [Mizuhopecten yessoensis]
MFGNVFRAWQILIFAGFVLMSLLCEICGAVPFQGLLTRIAESTTGAHTILRCGLMQGLAGCSFFDMRPELERSRDTQGVLESEEVIPSPMARYEHVLFASLKLCLALHTSLGIENQDAGNLQVH